MVVHHNSADQDPNDNRDTKRYHTLRSQNVARTGHRSHPVTLSPRVVLPTSSNITSSPELHARTDNTRHVALLNTHTKPHSFLTQSHTYVQPPHIELQTFDPGQTHTLLHPPRSVPSDGQSGKRLRSATGPSQNSLARSS